MGLFSSKKTAWMARDCAKATNAVVELVNESEIFLAATEAICYEARIGCFKALR